MEKRNSRQPEARDRCGPGLSSFEFLFSIFALLVLGGCGAPGEPTPPSAPIPAAITDLRARQAGDAVLLTFTLPTKSIKGESLLDPPAVEVLRGALKPEGSPDARSFRVVHTVPGAMIERYRSEEHIEILDAVPPEARAHPSGLIYRVRTRVSRRRASGDSNAVIVRMLPVAERITAVQAKVNEAAIELTWAAPTHTSSGAPLSNISDYRVYRGEIDPVSADAASKDFSQAEWKSPLHLLGSAPTNTYRDTEFDFDKTYVYVVRTVTSGEGGPIESSDSLPTIVTPRDTFPPAVPQGLVAAVIVGSPTNPAEVDLSWSINTEPDLAGYRVYRSEQQDTAGELVTPDMLLSPAYRDTSVQPGHHYFYSVTAVDRSGNESARSTPVAAEITQPCS